jgi:hypothetical protein
MVTQAPFGSTDPLDLYAWLEKYEDPQPPTARRRSQLVQRRTGAVV